MPTSTADLPDETHRELAYRVAHVAYFSVSAGRQLNWSQEALEILNLQAGAEPSTWEAFVEQFLKEALPRDLDRLLETRDTTIAPVTFEISDAASYRVAVSMRAAPQRDALIGALHDRWPNERREAHLLQVGDRLEQLGRWGLLGEMASGLAHELNQPLAAISAFAQAGERMLKKPEPQLEKIATLFQEVSQQALRAGAVIDRMRSLIKRQANAPEVLACTVVLADFQSMAAPIARAHHVNLKVESPDPKVHVRFDPSHIQQVLMSLFRNALDAMQDIAVGEREVTVSVRVVDSRVEMSVADSGPGISPAVAKELFRPFFTTKPEGTGLGLSVCRSILADHGGSLRFANGERGVAFILSLPLAAPGVAPSGKGLSPDRVGTT